MLTNRAEMSGIPSPRQGRRLNQMYPDSQYEGQPEESVSHPRPGPRLAQSIDDVDEPVLCSQGQVPDRNRGNDFPPHAWLTTRGEASMFPPHSRPHQRQLFQRDPEDAVKTEPLITINMLMSHSRQLFQSFVHDRIQDLTRTRS